MGFGVTSSDIIFCYIYLVYFVDIVHLVDLICYVKGV